MTKRNPTPVKAAPDLNRRLLLAASAGLMLPRWTWAQSNRNLALCWKLEEAADRALESVSGKMDPISSRTGHAIWVGTGDDRALRLDGYSVWVEQEAAALPLSSGRVTVAAWLALESFPVNDTIQFATSEGFHPQSRRRRGSFSASGLVSLSSNAGRV